MFSACNYFRAQKIIISVSAFSLTGDSRANQNHARESTGKGVTRPTQNILTNGCPLRSFGTRASIQYPIHERPSTCILMISSIEFLNPKKWSGFRDFHDTSLEIILRKKIIFGNFIFFCRFLICL